MGGAVFTQTDRVVGEEVDDMGLRQRRQADPRAGVVAEDEERAPDGQYATVQGHPVHRGGHGVLADAEVELSTSRVGVGLNLDRSAEVDAGVAREVAGSGDEARNAGRRGRQALVDGFSRRQLRAGLEAGQSVGPAREAPAGQTGLEPVAVPAREGLALLPGLSCRPAALGARSA